MDQDGPKMAPRRLQDGPRWPQDGSKIAPRGPKNIDFPYVVLRFSQLGQLPFNLDDLTLHYVVLSSSWGHLGTILDLFGAILSHPGDLFCPRWPQEVSKMAQDGPKIAPSWPRDGPR